tara:strand:+ start:2590 stop:3558 length:969 start_codon:yes stop_codon:yes gene_type:complete
MATWKELVDVSSTQTLTNKTLTGAVLGSSTATTQSASDNSTKVATTAYVDNQAAQGDKTLSHKKLWIGNSSGQKEEHTLSGAITVGADGTTALANDGVTYAKIQNVATANRVLGSTSADGIVAEVQVQTAMIAADAITNALIADDQIDSEHYVDGSIDTAHIADDAVDGSKLANNIDIAGTLDVTSAATFDSTVTISGNLTVAGTTTTVNATDLNIKDKNILLNKGTHTDDAGAVNTADGAGISVQTDSGNDSNSIANYANLTWNKSGALTGWQVEDTANAGSFPIAIMEHSSNSTAPTGNAGGVGSFHFDSGDDKLYVRTA